VGGVERELNSAALIDAIKDSIDAFSHQMTEDSNYG
jgi:flagellar assembly protein FliH